MPVELGQEFYKSQVFDRLRLKVDPTLPSDTVMMLGHFSASLVVDGQVRAFRWDEERFYPHGLVLIGLHEVEV